MNFTKDQQIVMLHDAARASGMDGHIVSEPPPGTMAERVMTWFGGRKNTPRKNSYLYLDTSHHNVPKDWSPEYLKEQIEKYNSTNSPSHKAFLVEVEDGSFEQYLLDSLHRKYRLAADAIQAAKDALGEALDCIESLEVKER